VFVPLPLPIHYLPIAVCFGTAALLIAQPAASPVLGPLARVGDLSYSLYLVHWPLFAFANVIWLGIEPPLLVRIGLIALAGLLSWLLYRFVEWPLRFHPAPTKRVLGVYLAATLVIAALIGALLWQKRQSESPFDLSGVTGLNRPGCDPNSSRFSGLCAVGSQPEMLVWGDSFSQHLVPALQVSGAKAFAQASKGQCAPLIGLAPVDRDATPAFARGCLSYNASVLEYLRNSPNVRIVVLAGFYQRYAQEGTLAMGADGSTTVPSMSDVVDAQRLTTEAIRAMGKRVVVVTGPAQASFDVGQCWSRQIAEMPMVAPSRLCRIAPNGRAETALWTGAFFDRVARDTGTPVLRLDQMLCPQGEGDCETRQAGVPLYRDSSHLSAQGSILVGQKLGLFELVRSRSR
jgi:hypothetical protein